MVLNQWLSPLLSAGAPSGSTKPTPPPDNSANDKTLTWANWALYLDEDDSGNHPTLDAFTAATGISAEYKVDVDDNNSYYGKVKDQLALGQDIDPGEGGEPPRVKWNVAKLLHEGTEIQFDRPIYAGDVLTMKSMLKSITTREGRSGLRTIYTMEQAFYDPSGKRVCALLIKTSEGQ